MPSCVVLTPESTVTVESGVDGRGGTQGDAVVPVSPTAVAEILGWQVEDRGLCRGDVCIPLAPDDPIRQGDTIDLMAAARLVGREAVIDQGRGVVAIPVEPDRRRSALTAGDMPDLTLADLDGHERRFSEFGRRRKLLVAFASW